MSSLRALLGPLDTVGRLVTLGVAVLLTPAAFAIADAVTSLELVARTGVQTTLEATQVVSGVRELTESASAMERHARQAAILDDPSFLELYQGKRRAFLQTATSLQARPLRDGLASQLDALLAAEVEAAAALAAHAPGTAAHRDGLVQLAELGIATRDLLDAAGESVVRATTELEQQTEALRRQLLFRAALVAPLALIVLVAGSRGVLRPLHHLEAEIRRVGDGELDRPVDVRGPTDVRLLGSRLEQMRTQLLAVEADRVRLFRHVSHELKTPLASIREGTQLLGDGIGGALSADQAEIVAIMQANAGLLQRRIEDLIRLSELRRGDTPLELDTIELHDLVERLVHQHRITAQGRGLTLRMDLDPITAQVDAARLPPALDNLLTNALKFAPQGSAIDVQLHTAPGDRWRLRVIDRGPGVPEAERERIFEPFYQGSQTRREYVQGTGIGLTIAREILRSHGGDVMLIPGDDGVGTCAVAEAPRCPEAP